MAEVVEKYSSECYLAPDNPRFENINTINEDVIKGFSNNNYHSFDDREKALMFALSHLKSDEILIIFGKNIYKKCHYYVMLLVGEDMDNETHCLNIKKKHITYLNAED